MSIESIGYSPLVLVHAGKIILAHLCTLETYIGVFEKTWFRIRQMKIKKDGTPISDANATIYVKFSLVFAQGNELKEAGIYKRKLQTLLYKP